MSAVKHPWDKVWDLPVAAVMSLNINPRSGDVGQTLKPGPHLLSKDRQLLQTDIKKKKNNKKLRSRQGQWCFHTVLNLNDVGIQVIYDVGIGDLCSPACQDPYGSPRLEDPLSPIPSPAYSFSPPTKENH